MKDFQKWHEKQLYPGRDLFPLSELAKRTAEEFGDSPALRAWNGTEYEEWTYNDLWRRAKAVAKWLIDEGIQREDKVSILGENRPEWAATYLAVQAAGIVVVPIDRLLPASGIRHIIADAGSKVIFCSDKYLSTLEEMKPVSSLKTVVCFDKTENKEYKSWRSVIDKGKASKTELPECDLDDTAAILYTSGTTGHSKGVMLTQRNLMSNIQAGSRMLPLSPEDTFLSVLPLHHAYECTAGMLQPLYCGCSITYARSMKSVDLLTDMRLTNVTLLLGVPLLFEKMHQGVERGIKKKGAVVKILFKVLYSLSALGEKFGKRWGRVLFRSFREKAGMGSVKWFISGGGPLDPEDSVFFNRMGIMMLQGFGLTETSPITHLSPTWRNRPECIGPPFPGVEHKIINMNHEGIGELCLRGPNIFAGYYKNEAATEEVFDDEGWFHTGDLALIHEDNYVQITGRKKNMLVTGGGKNVYPEEIEYMINKNRFVAESLVLGVPRKKGKGDEVGALIFPDYEQVDLYFDEKGVKATEDDVFNLLKTEIKDAQKDLAEYKWIRHMKIMQEEFQKTSTRKVKRYLYSGSMLQMNGMEG